MLQYAIASHDDTLPQNEVLMKHTWIVIFALAACDAHSKG